MGRCRHDDIMPRASANVCLPSPSRVRLRQSYRASFPYYILSCERTRLSFLASPRPASSPGGCAPRVAAWRRPLHPASPRGVLPIRPAHHTGDTLHPECQTDSKASTANGTEIMPLRYYYLEFDPSKKRDAIIFVMPMSSCVATRSANTKMCSVCGNGSCKTAAQFGLRRIA